MNREQLLEDITQLQKWVSKADSHITSVQTYLNAITAKLSMMEEKLDDMETLEETIQSQNPVVFDFAKSFIEGLTELQKEM